MRIYNDCLEMVKEVERDLAEMGIAYDSETVQDQQLTEGEKATKELSPYAYTLVSDEGRFSQVQEFLKYNKTDKKWADYHAWVAYEAIDRIDQVSSNRNPGYAWMKWEDFWSQYIRNGKFSYSYKERWGEQIEHIVTELLARPQSRQLIMTMYDRHQDIGNWGGIDRVPCSLTYHFLYRKEKLNLIYSQRSCDFYRFFQADVYFGLVLLQMIAKRVNAKVGNFTHFINSLHVFEKDLQGVF